MFSGRAIYVFGLLQLAAFLQLARARARQKIDQNARFLINNIRKTRFFYVQAGLAIEAIAIDAGQKGTYPRGLIWPCATSTRVFGEGKSEKAFTSKFCRANIKREPFAFETGTEKAFAQICQVHKVMGEVAYWGLPDRRRP